MQNSLLSFPGDVETTQRVIDAQTGPVVVVAHSYGGAVISGAAARPNVKALVYIAAFAPDAGEIAPLLGSTHPICCRSSLRTQRGLSPARPRRTPRCSHPTSPRRRAEAMAVAQKPLAARPFVQTIPPRPGSQSQLVHDRAAGSRDRSGSRAVLCEAHERQDHRDQVEPRGFPLASVGCRETDSRGGRRIVMMDSRQCVAAPRHTRLLGAVWTRGK